MNGSNNHDMKEALPPSLMDLVEEKDVEYQMTKQQDDNNVILNYKLPQQQYAGNDINQEVTLEEKSTGIESRVVPPASTLKSPKKITVIYPKRSRRAKHVFLACCLSQVILVGLFVAFLTQRWINSEALYKNNAPDDESSGEMVVIGVNDTFGVNELVQGQEEDGDDEIYDDGCRNDPNFIDEYGWDCDWYDVNEFEGCPEYGDCVAVDDVTTAKAACCHCGGGIRPTDEVDFKEGAGSNSDSGSGSGQANDSGSGSNQTDDSASGSGVEEECLETAPSIEVDKDCYEPGETILISFVNCQSLVDDWLGIFESDHNIFEEGTYWVAYWHWACGNQQCKVATSRGTVEFNDITDNEEGSFRVHLRRNQGDEEMMNVVSSGEFQILEDCSDA